MLTDKHLLRAAVICLLGGLALAVVLIFSGCASSSLGKGLNAGVIGSGVADYVTTRSAITQGRGVEGNPLMGQSAWQQTLVKALGVAGVIGVAGLVDRQQKPILAHLVRSVAIAVNLGLAVHNGRVIR